MYLCIDYTCAKFHFCRETFGKIIRKKHRCNKAMHAVYIRQHFSFWTSFSANLGKKKVQYFFRKTNLLGPEFCKDFISDIRNTKKLTPARLCGGEVAIPPPSVFSTVTTERRDRFVWNSSGNVVCIRNSEMICYECPRSCYSRSK